MSSTNGGKRLPNDAYYTEPALARRLVDLLPIPPGSLVLEPSVGGGAFASALQSKTASINGCDIDPEAKGFGWCANRRVGDFAKLTGWPRFDWVVGNPPFSRPVVPERLNSKGDPIMEGAAEDHARKALGLADNVAFLLRLAFLESKDRRAFWEEFPARHIWVLAERPSFTGGGTDSCAYGFFWWQRWHEGPTTISRCEEPALGFSFPDLPEQPEPLPGQPGLFGEGE